jgi:hypothetical protein
MIESGIRIGLIGILDWIHSSSQFGLQGLIDYGSDWSGSLIEFILPSIRAGLTAYDQIDRDPRSAASFFLSIRAGANRLWLDWSGSLIRLILLLNSGGAKWTMIGLIGIIDQIHSSSRFERGLMDYDWMDRDHRSDSFSHQFGWG